MSCGYELTHLRPEPDEYNSVKDHDVKEVLQYIFKDDFTTTIEQVQHVHEGHYFVKNLILFAFFLRFGIITFSLLIYRHLIPAQ